MNQLKKFKPSPQVVHFKLKIIINQYLTLDVKISLEKNLSFYRNLGEEDLQQV